MAEISNVYELFMEIIHLLYFRCDRCSLLRAMAVESINKSIWPDAVGITAVCACVFELLQSIINHKLKIGLLM